MCIGESTCICMSPLCATGCIVLYLRLLNKYLQSQGNK